MLTTVFILAVTLNFEPTRAGVAALILSGRNPIRHLAAFLGGILLMAFVVGLLVLFVFHHALARQEMLEAGKIQVGIGVLLLVLAVILATNVKLPSLRRRSATTKPATETDDIEIPQSSLISRVLTHSAKVTDRSSPSFFFALGLGFALPSVDYTAMLLLIASSGAPAVAQIAILLMFLMIGNLVMIIPLVCYRLAPRATLMRVDEFQSWLRSRSRREVAAMAAALGIVVIALGVMNI